MSLGNEEGTLRLALDSVIPHFPRTGGRLGSLEYEQADRSAVEELIQR